MRTSNIETEPSAITLLRNAREAPPIGVVYRGKVINNQDPSNTGRVKVNIHTLYSNLEEEDIPWALPCFSMASYNAGSFIIPQINDNVWVLFESNDIFKPVYIGTMYTTADSRAMSVGSSVAPAHQNYVPYEGLQADHFVIMKTPEGSGMWMNDERGTAHLYSSNGGVVDLEEDRVTMQYASGGTINSMDRRVVMFSPLGASVDIDDGFVDKSDPHNDNKNSAPAIYITRSADNKISLVEGKGLTIQYSEGADQKIFFDKKKIRISRNEEEQTITFEDGKVKIENKDNNISLEDSSVKIEHKDGSEIIIDNGTITIKANQKIHLKAPSIRIEGQVDCDGC